jgi:hypothetical protein
MNAAMVSSIVSLIPERIAREQSGSRFGPAESVCRYPERVAHLAKFLQWLTPLEVLGKDDQQILGLLNANGRPVHAADLEDDEGGEPLDAESPLEVERPIDAAQEEALV